MSPSHARRNPIQRTITSRRLSRLPGAADPPPARAGSGPPPARAGSGSLPPRALPSPQPPPRAVPGRSQAAAQLAEDLATLVARGLIVPIDEDGVVRYAVAADPED